MNATGAAAGLQVWGGSGTQNSANAVGEDSRGNVLVAGAFAGNVNFGGGTRSAPPDGAAFLAVYDPDLNHRSDTVFTYPGFPGACPSSACSAAVNDWRMSTSEKAETWEIGTSWAGTDVLSPGDNFSVRGNYYSTKMWDVTSYSASGSTSENLSRIETEGFELEASYGLSNGVYFDLQGSTGQGTEYAEGVPDTDWRNQPATTVGLTLGRK